MDDGGHASGAISEMNSDEDAREKNSGDDPDVDKESSKTAKTRKPKKRKPRKTLFCRTKIRGKHLRKRNLKTENSSNLPEIGIDDPDVFECVIPDDEERTVFLEQLKKLQFESEKEMQTADGRLTEITEAHEALYFSTSDTETTVPKSDFSLVGSSTLDHDYCSSPSFPQEVLSPDSIIPISGPSSTGGYCPEDSESCSSPVVPVEVLQLPEATPESMTIRKCPLSEDQMYLFPQIAQEVEVQCEGIAVSSPPSKVIEDAFAMLKSLVPKPWIIFTDHSGFYILYVSAEYPRGLQREVSLLFNGTINVAVHGEPLTFGDKFISSLELSSVQLNAESVQKFCERGVCVVNKVLKYVVCIGANDIKFKTMWESTANCYIDNNPYKEKHYASTCRSVSCPKLILSAFGRIRCESCNQLMKNFRRRIKFVASETAKLGTRDSYLTHKQALNKLCMLRDEIRRKNSKISYLMKKLDTMLENEGVELDEELDSDLHNILSNSKLSEPQKMFLEQQLQCSEKGNSRSHRWHPSMIRLALYLKMVSNTAYEALRDSGAVQLPCSRTLYDYSHAFAPQVGVSEGILKLVEEKISKFNTSHQKYVGLLVDEMHVSKNLVYGPDGSLMGYTHLEDVEKEMKEFENFISGPTQSRNLSLANKVLAFMVRGLTSGVKFVVASYPCNVLSKDMLYSRTWDVIGRLEMRGVKVLVVVTDGSSVNRGFIDMHTPITITKSGVVFDTINFCSIERRPLFFVADVAHLLKTVRNCFHSSGEGNKPRCMEINGETIVWKTIIRLYLTYQSCNFRKSFKLNARNVFPNAYSAMKVRDAAVVLSDTVANDIESQNWPHTTECVRFIRKINQFFDCLNGRDTFEHIRKRNPNLAPYTQCDDPRFEWLQSFLKYLKDWEEQVQAMKINPADRNKKLLSYQTRQGIEMAIESITAATRYLLKEGAAFVLARCFSNDPIEQHFSRQRAAGGGSNNPNVSQFLQRQVSMSVQRDLGIRRKRANVEDTKVGMDVTNDPLPKRRQRSAPKK